MKNSLPILLVVCLLLVIHPAVTAQENSQNHQVTPGDTWAALAFRFSIAETALRQANPQLNSQRPPVIGSIVIIPGSPGEKEGWLQRPFHSPWQTALSLHKSPWLVALQNNLSSPYHPHLYAPLFLPEAGRVPQDLPPGFTSLEVSQLVAQPGQALGIRGGGKNLTAVTAELGGKPIDSFGSEERFIALTGTGAFFGTQQPLLAIRSNDAPLWSQPWQFVDPNVWDYQQITLTGEAAAIDQESIRLERERLFVLWAEISPTPLWDSAFQLPINNYLSISSSFGARRSYNGGAYNSYHEGVDFAAYGGTAVVAPAGGTVVLAEPLYVRGGAVILDHGLGIFSGYYHMSDLSVAVGDRVTAGQQIGAVGTTGLSTGNHLHWDLLVDGIWVDASRWQSQNMACWILAGLGKTCANPAAN